MCPDSIHRGPRRPAFCVALFALSLVLLLPGATVAQTVTDDFELGDSTAPPLAGTGDIESNGSIAGPDWKELFNADGSHKDDVDATGQPPGNGIADFIDIYGGLDALFIGDDVSVGSAIDGTIRYNRNKRVQTGPINGNDDLGNTYVYLTNNTAGERVLYAGIERMSNEPATIELEFNQGHFRLGHGWPATNGWEVLGEKTDKDLKLVVDIAAGGSLTSVQIKGWEDPEADGVFEWVPKLTLNGEGCNLADPNATPPLDADLACSFRNDVIVTGGDWPSFDASGNPTTEISADCFFEIGVNFGKLLNITDPAYGFTTVQLRTETDIAFGYFGEGN